MASNVQREATKRPGRSRWNANPQQLQTLESIFEQGNGNTPNKPRIKDIAVELSQYGPISDTNVYNWFQNRKARAKRKLQHQVSRRRKLARTTADHALQLDLKEEGTKTGEDEDVASPSAKRFKGEGDLLVQNEAMSCLKPHSHLGAKSSSAGGIERVLTDDLRLHVDFATLATDPQLPSVDPATDMLFSDHGFHEQVAGTTDPSSPLQEISVEVKEWDVRNSYGESSNMVDSQTSYLPSHDVDNFNCLSGLAGDKYLISLAGGPVPSVEEFRKGAAETRGLKTEEAITAAASETCV